MAKSNLFSKAFHNFLPFRDFLYLLQLEEYYYGRTFKTFSRFYWRRGLEKRDHLKWTSRAKITCFLSVILFVFIPIFINDVLVTDYWSLVTLTIISLLLIPIWIALANLILTPLFIFARWRVCQHASAYLSKHFSQATVVAIAGSYGKTTTKNFLQQLLRSNYRIEMTPGNINTAAGIAQWILKKELNPSTQILLIEMDAYKPGEIKQTCQMVKPDISLITVIGDQHLEKFGSERRLAESLLEVFQYTKSGGTCFVTANNRHVTEKMKIDLPSLTKNKTVINVSTEPLATNLTSASAIQDLHLAIAVARLLNVPEHFIEDTCHHLELPDRRQKSSMLFGYELVDDSYNISFSTALAGLARAKQEAKTRNKKLLVMTAGIAEMSPNDSRKKNREFGQELGKHADKIVLLKSIFYPFVLTGIQEQKKDAILSPNFQEGWRIIREMFSPEEYFILMQPELTDLSY